MRIKHKMTIDEMSSLGGKARAAKYSEEEKSEMARKGGEETLKRLGREHFVRIAEISKKKRAQKKAAQKMPGFKVVSNLLTTGHTK